MRYLRLLCFCIALNIAIASEYEVNYEESVSTFVDYPQDAVSQALVQAQPLVDKVHLQLWTTADDFQHPLFSLVKGIVRRLDSDLIIFEPSYYLRDGATEGCRLVDPATGQEEENLVNLGCSKNCTHHGRYCAGSTPKVPSLAAKVDGADIVEESLRQLCVWVVYGKTGGGNMLHYFNYINDPQFQQCDDPFSKACTYPIMDRIGIVSHFIERCMNHTHGVDEDEPNPYLREQLDKSEGLTSEMLPTLKIGREFYSGELSTKAIFGAVCAAYPADKLPVACEFCQNCDDVRYCLWNLQCGGQDFKMYAASRQNSNNNNIPESEGNNNVPALNDPSDNANPGESTESGSASPAAPQASPADPQTPAKPQVSKATSPSNSPQDDNNQQDETSTHDEDKQKQEAQHALISGLLVGLSIGLLVSGFYACRYWRARQLRRQIANEDRVRAAIKEREAMMNQDSHSSAAGMLKRLQHIEQMIDGGKQVGDLLDVVSERTVKTFSTRVEA